MPCAGCTCSDTGIPYGGAGQTTTSAKYTAGSGAVGIGAVSTGCLESLAGGGAVSYDPVDHGCWGITGKRIPIAETYASIQAFAELVNFNFHVNGSQPAVPTNYALALVGPSLSPNIG
ncbi:MAG: hypothetical protein ACP5JL_09825 [bacterium]